MLVMRKTGVVPPGRWAWYEKETKTPFTGFSTLKLLADEVRRHRTANNIPIGTSFLVELQDFTCRRIDEYARSEWCAEEGELHARPVRRPGLHAASGFNGAAMWAELHRYALMERPTAEQREQWLAVFAKRLPCNTCRPHWRAICAELPLAKTAGHQEFFEWTVEAHSRVSESIGKQRMELAAALERWSS